MIEETLSFTITNNTNGNVPISIFGNEADNLDNANVDTRYYWDVTSYTYESSTIILVATSGGVTTTYTTTYTGTTLEDVIIALNQLGLAYFFLTTSGGSTFINVYSFNYTFGNLTIGNTTLLNSTFVPLNFNNTVLAVKVQADGNILFGGQFTQYNAITYNRIVRLLPDGSVDATFSIGTGFNDRVFDIDVQADGKIICVGGFTSYNGTPASKIIRLNADGSIDGTFVYGTGFTIPVIFGTTVQVQTVKVIASGKIMVVGAMDNYNGNAINGICRLNTNGSIDGTFSAGGVSVATGEYCTSIAEQVDGKYIVVGNYTTFNGVPKNAILRLNTGGTTDGTFGGTGFTLGVGGTIDVDLQTDGKIVVCGTFSAYSGTSSPNIARINTNGTIDGTFVVGTGFDAPTINAVIYSSGKIVIGGQFTTYQGVTSNRIIKLNSDGSIDTAWNVLGGFATGEVSSISINASETLLYMGGSFLTFDGVTRVRACSLTS